MELKATTLGKRLAQHPYDRAVILNAGIKVSGDRHEYLIPFNQLLAIHCKRGLVWGELEFVLPDEKVVRLHGTEWGETQRFYHHLDAHWRRWSGEMSEIASGVLRQQLDLIATRTGENKWLTREQTSGVQQQIRQALSALPLPVGRALASRAACAVSTDTTRRPTGHSAIAAILKFAMPTGMPMIEIHCAMPVAMCIRHNHQPKKISQKIFNTVPPVFSSTFLPAGFSSST